jgi:hypothetical protein
MNKLIALCYFVLSLYGCDVGSSTSVYRAQADGSDVLYSKVVTQAGIARFDCVRSASGKCHYSVFSRECAAAPDSAAARSGQPPVKRCRSTPVERFDVANGDSRWIPGLHAFSVCVSSEGRTIGPDCQSVEPIAAR